MRSDGSSLVVCGLMAGSGGLIVGNGCRLAGRFFATGHVQGLEMTVVSHGKPPNLPGK